MNKFGRFPLLVGAFFTSILLVTIFGSILAAEPVTAAVSPAGANDAAEWEYTQSLPDLGSPRHAVERAWELAQQSGTYNYRSEIDQTTYPAPSIVTAGRPPKEEQLALEGSIDQPSESMEMTVWRNKSYNPDTGISIKIEEGQAFQRNGDGAWEEIGNVADAFAPGNDPLGFLAGMKNIQEGQAESRQFVGSDFALILTPYTFELDDVAYATYLKQIMETQLREKGELPAGMSLDVADQYHGMMGTGELWLTEDGLPFHLSMNIQMPPEDNGEIVHATIETDFYNFDLTRLSQLQIGFFEDPQTWANVRNELGIAEQAKQQASVTLFFVGFFFLLAVLIVRYGRTRPFYKAVVALYLVASLVGPLMQAESVYAYSEDQYHRQEEAKEQQAQEESRQNAIAAQYESAWDPHQDPMTKASVQPAPPAPESVDIVISDLNDLELNAQLAQTTTITATMDSDGDGLLDVDEAYWFTCDGATNPNAYCDDAFSPTDYDGDTLSDGVEVNNLGTTPTEADSDGDAISDTLELNGFSYAGTQWYLDPSEIDSNKDGLPDGLECPEWALAPLSTTDICPDTDGDGLPDVFDADNDNDGVDDAVDLSPFSGASDLSKTFSQGNPMQLVMNNLTVDKPVLVELQFQPINQDNLTLIGNILDWPVDIEGQIQRNITTTFASTKLETPIGDQPQASNGDILITPMLEVTMPYTDGHYANLPISPTFSITRSLGITVADWLDTTEFDKYGITINESKDGGDLTAYVPLSALSSQIGDETQAFTAQMFYWPQQGNGNLVDWGTAHQYRLIWLVQMLGDKCDTNAASYDSGTDSCHIADRVDEMKVIHVYQDDWRLTGFNVNESHGMDVSILYEDPVQDTLIGDVNLDDELWQASWNLGAVWASGADCVTGIGLVDKTVTCAPDGFRDITVLGDTNSDSIAGAVDKWSDGQSYLVTTHTLSYPHEGYMVDVGRTEMNNILTNTFQSYQNRTPTFLFAQEWTVRSVGQGESQAQFVNNQLTLNFDLTEVETTTYTGLRWATYRFYNGMWQNYALNDYLGALEKQLPLSDSYFRPADENDPNSVAEAEGRILGAGLYYSGLIIGMGDMSAIAGKSINSKARISEIDATWKDATKVGKRIGNVATLLLRSLVLTNPKTQTASIGWIGFKRMWQEATGAVTLGANPTNKGSGSFKALNKTGKVGSGLAVLALLIFLTGITLSIVGTITGDATMAKVGESLVQGTAAAYSVMKLATIAYKVGVLGKSMAAATSGLKIAGAIGTFLTLTLLLGIYIYYWASGDLTGRQLLRLGYDTLATSIVVVLLFLLSLIPFVGIVIVLLVALFDAITYFVCKVDDKSKSSDFCKTLGDGLVGTASKWLGKILFDVNYMHDLNDSNRLDVDIDGSLTNRDVGFSVGNSLQLDVVVTNTLKYTMEADLRDFTLDEIRQANFDYTLQISQTDRHQTMGFNTNLESWETVGSDKIRDRWILSRIPDFPYIVPFTTTGLNQKLNVYLTESYVLPVEECKMNFGFTADCSMSAESSSSHVNIGPTFDILPANVTEFAQMNWSTNITTRIPHQIDLDNDGWLAAYGDPNDRLVDTDGDGLSDPFELERGLNPRERDTDRDGLWDKEELVLGTDPRRGDGDGDNLSDYTEVIQGWLYDYGPGITRVWSNPYLSDTDGDGLDDYVEASFGQNPNIATDRSIIYQIVGIENLRIDEQSSPVLFMEFDEPIDSSAFIDNSGLRHTALCSGDSCPTAGEPGRFGAGGLRFDGNDSLTIEDSDDLDLEAFSISLWLSPTAVISQQSILQKGNSNGGESNYGLYLKSTPYPNYVLLAFNAHDSSCANLLGELSASYSLGINGWNAIAITFDGSTAKLFVNGVERGSQSYGTTGLCQNAHPLEIGGSTGTSTGFSGGIDDLIVYDYVLTEAEIDDLGIGITRPNVNDLIVHPGQALIAQATITQASQALQSAGFMSLNGNYIEPQLPLAEVALRFEAEDYQALPDNERTIAFYDGTQWVDNAGSQQIVSCNNLDNCPTLTERWEGESGRGAYFDGNDVLFSSAGGFTTGGYNEPEAIASLAMSVKVDQLPASGQETSLFATNSETPSPFHLSFDENGYPTMTISDTATYSHTSEFFSFGDNLGQWITPRVDFKNAHAGHPDYFLPLELSLYVDDTLISHESIPTTDDRDLHGYSMLLDGVDELMIVGDSPLINTGEHPTRTLSTWFQVDDAGLSTRKQVIYEEGDEKRGLNLYIYDGNLYAGGWNTPTTNSESGWTGNYISTTVTSRAWHHAAVVLSGTQTVTNGALSLYLNGQLVGTAPGSQLWSHPGETAVGAVLTSTLFHDGASSSGHHFAGRLDEIRLFNRPLPAGEVAILARTSQPIAYYNFDKPSEVAIVDNSGNNHHAIPDSDMYGAQWRENDIIKSPFQEGPPGHNSGYAPNTLRATVPDTDTLDLNSFAISFWIKPTGLSTGLQPVLAKEADDGSQVNYGLFFTTTPNFTRTVRFMAHQADCTTPITLDTSPTGIGWLGWTHVALSFDGTSARLYTNGIEDSSLTFSNTVTLCQNDHPIKLGREINAYEPLGVQVDEIRLYNQPLSAEEVSHLAGASEMAAYWNFGGEYLSPSPGTDGSSNNHTGTFPFGTNQTFVVDTPNYRVYDWSVIQRTNFGPGTLGNAPDGASPLMGTLDNVEMELSIDPTGAGWYHTDWGINFDKIDDHFAAKGVLNRADVFERYFATCGNLWDCPVLATGHFGDALAFDSITDYMEMPHVLDPGGTAFTAATWFNVADTNENRTLIDQADGSGTGRQWLYVNSSDQLATDLGGTTLSSSSTVTPSQWHHAAVSYDGSTLSLYLDGQVVAASRTLEASDGSMLLGVNQVVSGTQTLMQNYLYGGLDEVVIFATALPSSSVQAIMAGAYPAIFVREPLRTFDLPSQDTAVISRTAQVANDAASGVQLMETAVNIGVQPQFSRTIQVPSYYFLQAHMPLDEPPGVTSFENIISTSLEASCAQSGCPVAGVPGMVNTAAYFPGTGQALHLNGFAQHYPGLSVWVKAREGTIVYSGDPSGTGYQISMDKLEMRYEDPPSSGTVVSQTVPLNLPVDEWFHLVVGYNNGSAQVRVDGLPITSLAAPGGDGTGSTIIGGNGDGSDFLRGTLDDVRFQAAGDGVSPMGAHWINLDARHGTPILRFDFDEEAGARTYADTSINNYNTTIPTGDVCVDGTIDRIYINHLENEDDYFFLDLGGERLLTILVSDLQLDSTLLIPFILCGSATLTGGVLNNGVVLHSYDWVLNSEAFQNANYGFGTGALNNETTVNADVLAGPSYLRPNPPLGSKGKIGNKAIFDGTGYVEVQDATTFNVDLGYENVPITNALTIMAWVKPETVSGTLSILGANRTNSDNGLGFGIRDGKLLLSVYGGQDYVSEATVEAGIWQHVAVALDRGNLTAFYVNGERQTTLWAHGSSINSDDSLLIGAHSEISGTISQFYKGEMDELIVYGFAMQDSEIYYAYMSELLHYSDSRTAQVTIDADNPTLNLVNEASYWPQAPASFIVSVDDATSDIETVRFNILPLGFTNFHPDAFWTRPYKSGVAVPCNPYAGGIGAWCIAVPDTFMEPGQYEIILRATDVVGNETYKSYPFSVDGEAPIASSTYSGGFVPAVVRGAESDFVWTFSLAGTISDPNLRDWNGKYLNPSVAGSGVMTESVTVALIDDDGKIVGGAPQQATSDGSTWSIDYRVVGQRLSGPFVIEVTAEDVVGNSRVNQVGTVQLDTLPPSVNIDWSTTASNIISGAHTFSGWAFDRPDFGTRGVSFNFREGSRTTAFADNHKFPLNPGEAPITLSCITAECPLSTYVLPGVDTGVFGAVDFDGIDDNLSTQHGVLNKLGPELTFSLWVKPDTLPDGGATARLMALETVSETNVLLSIDANQRLLFSVLIDGVMVDVQASDAYSNILTTGEYQHIAGTLSEQTMRLYHNGIEVGTPVEVTGTIGASNILRLSQAAATFDGEMDEVMIYNYAFSAKELAELIEQNASGIAGVDVWLEPYNFDGPPAAENWQPTSFSSQNTWQYNVPDGLEDYYRLKMRAQDAQNNYGRNNIFWRGAIDEVPPRITFSAEHQGSSSGANTFYTFVIEDLFLDTASIVQPCDPSYVIEHTHPDYNRVNRVTSGHPTFSTINYCTQPGHQEGTVTVAACDLAGRCSSESIELAPPPQSNFIDILSPLDQTTWPVNVPVDISGSSNAADGIQAIEVQVNDDPFVEVFFDTSNPFNPPNELNWSSPAHFTPTTTGTYTIVAKLTSANEEAFTDTAVITVVNDLTNTPPVAGNDQISTIAPDPISINVLANDSDPDGDPLVINGVSNPISGTVSVNGFVVVYDPAPGFIGDESFSYIVGDSNGGFDTGTVTVTVNSFGVVPPVAVDDNVSTPEDTALDIYVLDNDTLGDVFTLTVLNFTNPANGSVSSDGTVISYTPNPDFTGSDVFVYTVDNGYGSTDTGVVTVMVDSVDDPPVAMDDTATTDEDTAVNIDVLSNDSDVDGDRLSINTVNQPISGTTTISGSLVVYTPTTNINGMDVFSYTMGDGQGGLSTATVTVTVNAINDAPIVEDDLVTTVQNQTIIIDVLANDSDVDGDTLTVDTIATAPVSGTAVMSGSLIVYTPTTAFIGTDMLQYTVSDSSSASSTATVTIKVRPTFCETITTHTELDNCIQYANNNIGPDTLTLAANITVTGTLTPMSSSITLNGNDYAIDGNNSYRVFEVALGADVMLNGVTIRHGNASNGAGIINDGALALNHSTVLSNTASSDGGGIYNSGWMTITNSAVLSNTVVDSLGGGIYNRGTMSIVNSAIANNNAAGTNGVGGGIFNQGISQGTVGDLTLMNTTVSGNSASRYGGGITNEWFARLNLIHTTVTANSVRGFDGGGLYAGDAHDETIFVKNSIIVGNTQSNGSSDCYLVSYPQSIPHNWPDEFVSLGGNVFGADASALSCAARLTADDFAATNPADEVNLTLADNGGDTLTHALPTTSQAIDGAPDCTDTDNNPVTVDQRGVTRPQHEACDSGAYEYDGNTPPLAISDQYTGTEEVTLSVAAPGVLFNDSDFENSPMTAVLVSTTPSGTLTLNSDGSLDYLADANHCGSDSFTYAAHDGNVSGNTATVTLTIACTQDNPTAVDDTPSTNEDTGTIIDVLVNDFDVDGDSVSLNSVSQPTNGTAVNNGNNVTYTPDGNFNGEDSFTYTIGDGLGGTDMATVTVTVTAVNDAPVAVDDNVTTDEDVAFAIDVLFNDSDIEGDTLTIASVTAPLSGTAVISGSIVVYTPTLNFFGIDVFTYNINDGNNGTATATVTVTVNAVNNAPIANDDNVTTDEDTAVAIDVLFNDNDVDGDTLAVDSVTQPLSGTAVISGTDVVYTPTTNFNGVESFAYTASDGNGATATATVTVTVNAVNDAPIAVTDEATTDEDTAVTIDVLDNDSDVDGDSLTVGSVTQATNGAVSNNFTDVTYTPNTNFNGNDEFTYTVSDGNGAIDTVTVTVTVNPTNDPPTLLDDSRTTDEDTSIAIDVLTNDSDIDGDTLAVDSVTQPLSGTTVISGTDVVYTPTTNFNGAEIFTYTASDGNGETATATVTVTVNAVNDFPVALDDIATTDEDTPITIDVLTNDSDIDNDPLAIGSLNPPINGTAIISGAQVVFTPTLNFNGLVTFTYVLTDGAALSNAATVSVTVDPINTPPTQTMQLTPSIIESQSITIDLDTIISDVETAVSGIIWSASSADESVATVAIDAERIATINGINGSINGKETMITFIATDGGDPDGCISTPCSAPLSTTINMPVTVTQYIPSNSGQIEVEVWDDLNGDGRHQSSEPGLDGVVVQLLDASTGVVVYTDLSSDGVSNLFATAGSYRIQVILPDGNHAFTRRNRGNNEAIDSDVNRNNGRSARITLAENDLITTVDVGLWTPATIVTEIWDDLNGNGRQNDDEPLVSVPIIVNLLDNGNNILQTTTAINGVATFTNVPANTNVKLEYVLPEGYAFTDRNNGNDTRDSDASRSNGRTHTFRTTGGAEIITNVDAGMWSPGEIETFVWDDVNGNGRQNSNELGVAGVTVNLLYNDNSSVIDPGTGLSVTAVTDSAGVARLTYVPADTTVKLQYVQPTGYEFTARNVGNDAQDSDPRPNNGLTSSFSTSRGNQLLDNWDAGLLLQ